MNAKTMRQLDECLERAAEDMRRNRNNPQHHAKTRRRIMEIRYIALQQNLSDKNRKIYQL